MIMERKGKSGAHKGRISILKFASAALGSQLAFSLATLLSMAAFSRGADKSTFAALLACYAVQSISVAYGRQALIVARIQRYSDVISKPDFWHIAKWCAIFGPLHLAASSLTFSLLTDSKNLTTMAVSLWVSSMLVADVVRFAASRFDETLLVQTVSSVAYIALIVVSSTLLHLTELSQLLITLAVVNCFFAVALFWRLYCVAERGPSTFSAKHGVAARNMGVENAAQAALQAVSTSLLAAFVPAAAVGLQLLNQTIGTPVGVVAQTLSSSLGRLIRVRVGRNELPVRLLALWSSALVISTFALAAILSFPLSIAMRNLFGENWELTEPLFLAMTVYFASIFAVQVMTLPSRWWVRSDAVRNWTICTLIFFNATLTAVLIVEFEPRWLYAAISAVGFSFVSFGRIIYVYCNRPQEYKWV